MIRLTTIAFLFMALLFQLSALSYASEDDAYDKAAAKWWHAYMRYRAAERANDLTAANEPAREMAEAIREQCKAMRQSPYFQPSDSCPVEKK